MKGRGCEGAATALVFFTTRSVAVDPGYPWLVASQQSQRPFGRKSFVLRCGGGFVVGSEDGWLGFGLGIVTPVGLEEDGVDLFEIDGFGAVSDGFDGEASTAAWVTAENGREQPPPGTLRLLVCVFAARSQRSDI
ncbi:hypothetical protein JIN85_17720 [Luteolibacter pohnpeiensis]|uniref:Uncharacterized protein n=1 Tax=Luteolibacter pohnpeiensis TaxID=454153 RepID=A0A934SDR5_9BACT|nr:hypothetical protein [Luteolibacter pohnpeiensis]MBK1884262.1 hypothetical protein [Luteolibacter pohnpeiensis]